MSSTPIERHFDYGLTFRWKKTDNFIVVKRGYVVEGVPVIIVRPFASVPIDNTPEDTRHDEHTWVGVIPANNGSWGTQAIHGLADHWAEQNPHIADFQQRTRQTMPEGR